MKRIKQQKKSGISLIVLVITIIVMIILAAAIILSLDGSNIIDRAKGTQSTSDIATAKEIVALAKSEWAFEKVDGYESVKEYAEAKLEEAGYKVGGNGGIVLSETSTGINTLYIGSDNRQAIIPEGFKVSTVSTEDTVTEGLVIVDSKGNEFVWIPVDDFAKFARTTTYNGTITDPGTDYYLEPYTSGYSTEVEEYNAMRDSVEEYGGFYIGRYEAGTTIERTNTANGTTELVVQKNKPVYNYVGWGTSMSDITGDILDFNNKNQGKGAVALSKKMYKSSPSVVSTLCYGVQWDSALQFIYNTDSTYPTNSTDKGNYTNSLKTTGADDSYAVNNIYDMAGNAFEWTMESGMESFRVIRGDYNSAANRSTPGPGTFPYDLGLDRGFRIALYIK